MSKIRSFFVSLILRYHSDSLLLICNSNGTLIHPIQSHSNVHSPCFGPAIIIVCASQSRFSECVRFIFGLQTITRALNLCLCPTMPSSEEANDARRPGMVNIHFYPHFMFRPPGVLSFCTCIQMEGLTVSEHTVVAIKCSTVGPHELEPDCVKR